MFSSGSFPRTKMMHTMSSISAVRTTWGLHSPGDEHGTFAAVCEHIAHHVSGKDELGVKIRQFFPVQEFCVKGFLHFSDRHKNLLKKIVDDILVHAAETLRYVLPV